MDSSRNDLPNYILQESERVAGASLGTAENMLRQDNKILLFTVFIDSLDILDSGIFGDTDSSNLTREYLNDVITKAKNLLAKGNIKVMSIVGEGNILDKKYSNGIPDAIIIKIFHRDTDKVIEYVYPFTREKTSITMKFNIDVKKGLRFITE